MVRIIRIFCVSSIAFFLTFSLLFINKTIHLSTWISCSKVFISGIIFSLVYLLFDANRKNILGKIGITSTLIGVTILLFSLFTPLLHMFWNVAFGLFLLSFILILFSRISNKNYVIKYLFFGSLNIPLGICLGKESVLFYSISSVLLLLLTVYSLFSTLRHPN